VSLVHSPTRDYPATGQHALDFWLGGPVEEVPSALGLHLGFSWRGGAVLVYF
jgi:hypothetical protein